MVENLDKTFPNVHSSNKHYEWQAKEVTPTILGRKSNTRNIRNIAWKWGRQRYSTSQTKWVFSPKNNVDYQVFQFCQVVQQSGETVDQFITRLQKLAATCKFVDVAKEIKSAVIQNCLSKRSRWYALREDALTLDNLIPKAHSLEASKREVSGMEKKFTTEEANLIS